MFDLPTHNIFVLECNIIKSCKWRFQISIRKNKEEAAIIIYLFFFFIDTLKFQYDVNINQSVFYICFLTNNYSFSRYRCNVRYVVTLSHLTCELWFKSGFFLLIVFSSNEMKRENICLPPKQLWHTHSYVSSHFYFLKNNKALFFRF